MEMVEGAPRSALLPPRSSNAVSWVPMLGFAACPGEGSLSYPALLKGKGRVFPSPECENREELVGN